MWAACRSGRGFVWGCAALLCALALAGPAAAGDAPPASILVRLRAEGPHAVLDCAEARQRRGQPLAGATRDGSDSLDRLHAQLGVQRVRAVFRRADGRSFAAQRASLRARTLAPRGRRARSLRGEPASAPDLSHVYRVELAAGVDPAAAVARYREDPHVVWAQQDIGAALDAAADDPFLSSSGSWGQSFPDLWGIQRVRAPEAWDHAVGEGIVVAVVDTGVDFAHPDLSENAWLNPGEDLDGDGRVDAFERNGVDDDGNGFVDDFHGFDFANSVDANGDGDFDDEDDVSDADPFDDVGHGTHIAGTVAAVANNGIGVAGVAPRARIMALKGFGASGGATFEMLVRGMLYAVENGADVINNSWSCSRRCPSNPIVEDMVALANAAGVVVVTSAGNRGDDVAFYSPENRRGTLTVGASDPADQATVFTNLGYGLDVLAPGGASPFGTPRVPQRAILSLLSAGANDGATGLGAFVIAERYLRWSGTSMSAPHVAGIAALVLSRRPELTPEDVRGVIRGSARDLGAAGHDFLHGAGLADALAAVTREPPAAGGAFESPLPAARLQPLDGPVSIRGRVFGDVAAARLSFGRGWRPAAFQPIPLLAPGAPEGELAIWRVASLEDGAYLLRLEVDARDGERIVEFLPVVLERNPPTQLSSAGPDALRPVVSGRRVVWQSARADAERGDDAPDLDLFARDWERGEEWRVVGGPGEQREPRLSGAGLVWRDEREGEYGVGACRLGRPGAPCRDLSFAHGPDRFPALEISGRRVVWTQQVLGQERLRACAWRGRLCHPLPAPAPLGPGPGRQSSPVVSGDRLYWVDASLSPPRLLTCRGLGERGCTPPVAVIQVPTAYAASGDLLAWQAGALVACRVAADGSCVPRLLSPATSFAERPISVSGHRVVWVGPGPGGDDDVFLCEDDPITGACPVQRLGVGPANQRNAAIDGDRVVWEDDGDGFVSVVGLELPSLRPLRDRRVGVGHVLRMTVRGRDPSGGALALSASFADGTPLEARGARFDDLGDGRGVLRWRPDASAVGSHVVSIAARSAGGLVARRSARVEVVASAAQAMR